MIEYSLTRNLGLTFCTLKPFCKFEHQTLYMRNFFIFILAIISFSVAIFAQNPTPTPPEDKPEVITTEEIKINISAIDEFGKTAKSLTINDLVVSENNVLHQPTSVRRIPASVLIILDTGGEERNAKDIRTTRATAKNLVNLLNNDDSIAVIQYADNVETLVDWTTNKAELLLALDKQLRFGKRSVFVDAINFATKMLENSTNDNRHIVLISDGLDSLSSQIERQNAIRNLLTTTANVHILSYTKMELNVVVQRFKGLSKRSEKRPNLPPGASNPTLPPGTNTTPGGMTINLDRAMEKKIKQRGDDLANSQRLLTQLSDDANGEIYLPETREEMVEIAEKVVKSIDSQFVVTYSPKRPLNEVKQDETRIIEVSSKRAGVIVQARRKLIVRKGR
jgi:von Willebrand factor type A domain